MFRGSRVDIRSLIDLRCMIDPSGNPHKGVKTRSVTGRISLVRISLVGFDVDQRQSAFVLRLRMGEGVDAVRALGQFLLQV